MFLWNIFYKACRCINFNFADDLDVKLISQQRISHVHIQINRFIKYNKMDLLGNEELFNRNAEDLFMVYQSLKDCISKRKKEM